MNGTWVRILPTDDAPRYCWGLMGRAFTCTGSRVTVEFFGPSAGRVSHPDIPPAIAEKGMVFWWIFPVSSLLVCHE